MKTIEKLDILNLPRGIELMTYKDVAAALQVSKSFVEKLAGKGKLRVVKIGRNSRVLPSDLQEYIKTRRV
jgi:excisionase family DNA binding protein